MPRTRPAALAATALAAGSVLLLSACSAGPPTGPAGPAGAPAPPGTTVPAPGREAASAPGTVEPVEPTTASPTPEAADAAPPAPTAPGGASSSALPDVAITDDYFADLERYWPGTDGIDTDLAVGMIEDVCDSTLPDGTGAGPAEGSAGTGDAGFSEGVRRYGLQGEVRWALPLVVAGHHCPDRVEAVGVVQRSVEAGSST